MDERLIVFILDDNEGFVAEMWERLVESGCEVEILGREQYRSDISPDQFFAEFVEPVLQCITKEAVQSVLLINADLKLSRTDMRSLQHGIHVLKHIRLTPGLGDICKAHTVLYSFQSSAALVRRKPENVILYSSGVTFLSLPESQPRMTDRNDLLKLSRQTADLKQAQFARFVRCEFRVPDDRHAFANWWGVRQLCLVQHAIDRSADYNFPSSVELRLRELSSKQAIFLMGTPSEEIERVVRKQLSQITQERDTVVQKISGSRIVYIDDEADQGWVQAFNRMLFDGRLSREESGKRDAEDYYLKEGPSRPVLRVIKTFSKDDPRLADEIVPLILDFCPDLVLMDLRLKGNREADVDVAKTSGASLLGALRRRDSGLPIIVVTASSKAWSFAETMTLGADAYWIKEGIDSRLSPESSVLNFRQLIRLIDKALSDKYQFLRRFCSAVNDLERRENHWWTKHNWPNGDETEAYRQDITAILRHLSLMLREYLYSYEMGYGYSPLDTNFTQKTAYWHTALITQGSYAIELVHNWGDADTSKMMRDDRHDCFAYQLYKVRNDSAHAKHANNAKFQDIQRFLAALITWLAIEPLNTPPAGEPSLQQLLGPCPGMTDFYQRLSGEQLKLLRFDFGRHQKRRP